MLVYYFLAFAAFGVCLVLVGANQADLQRELSLDLAQTGLLGSTLAAGLGVGIVAGGPLFDRYSRRPLFVGCMLIAGTALVTTGEGMGFARAVAHLLAVGLGIGIYDTLISGAVAERFGERSAKPMSTVHAGATMGAMFGAPAIGWLASQTHWSASFRWVGTAHLALAAAALAIAFPPPPRRDHRSSGGRVDAGIVPLACVAFAYVGVETALTVFAVPYSTGALGLDGERGRLAISALWLGLLVGRVAILALPGPLGPRLLVAAGALGAAFLGAGVLGRVTQVEILFGLVGLPLGCVFPLLIALAGQQFPHARGAAAGIAGGAGAAGGFAGPWITGAIGDEHGAGAAVGSLALWLLALAAAAIAAGWRPRH